MSKIAILIVLFALTVGSVACSVSEVAAQEVMSQLVMKAGQKV